MNPNLSHHLEKLNSETRTVVEILMMQNQADKKEQSGLQRDILKKFEEHEALHEGLDQRLDRLEKARLVFTTVLWVLGGLASILFASNAPRILHFFLSL